MGFQDCVPDHSFVLLLPDVGRNLAVNLTGFECHSQGFGHVGLDGFGNGWVSIGRTYPKLRRAFVLELARTKLGDFNARNEGEDDVGGEPLFKIRFDAKGVRGINEDASMLGSNDSFDNGSEVIDVGKSLDAE